MGPINRRTVLLAAGAGLFSCAPAPAEPIARAPLLDGHPHLVTPLSIAGREILAVIDNGAPVSSIDTGLAAELGLAPNGALASGRMTLPNTQARISGEPVTLTPLADDLSELALATERPVQAILGMELFHAYAVGLTGAGLSLYAKGGFWPPDAPALLNTGRAAGGEPTVPITLNGARASAVIDLGASTALLVSAAFAEARGIGEARRVSSRHALVFHDGVLTPSISTLTSVEEVGLAGRTLRDAPVNIIPQIAGPFAGYDVLIGVEALKRFDLWCDLPGRLWLGDSPRLAGPFVRRHTGIQVKPQDDGFRIRHVAVGSPAETAGLAVGDIITAIDGAPPALETLRLAAPGQRLTLELADGRTVSLTAARYY